MLKIMDYMTCTADPDETAQLKTWPQTVPVGLFSTNDEMIFIAVCYCDRISYEPQHEKTNNVDSDQVWHKPGCAATGDG